jgi:Ferritin-like
MSDASGFEPKRTYHRFVPEGRLSPGPNDYNTVGGLYEVLASWFEACVSSLCESTLFIGDPLLQVDAGLAGLPGLIAVTDLASARQAIATIVTQGEGAGAEHADSHFSRFRQMGQELAALKAADPGFAPAWPAATNPVMNPPVHNASERLHISEARIAQWLDIGNALYTTSLRCLLQGFSATERKHKATWLHASFALMRSLGPVGLGLSARPATADANGPHAGLTFTPLRALALIPEASGPIFIAERLAQLRQRALDLPLALVAGETHASWQAVIDTLETQRQSLLSLAGVDLHHGGLSPSVVLNQDKVRTAREAAPSSQQAPAAQALQSAPSNSGSVERQIEIAGGQGITIKFKTKWSIHARHCVLDAPSVF